MKLTIHGAAQTVTGSQHLLEVNGKKLLLDCGLFQGGRGDTYERNRNFAYPVDSLDAMILSHGHIDHSGNLPHLIKNGYGGPIYTTPATKDLSDVMLRDSGHIQEADAEFVNKHRARRGEPPIEPLYTLEDAARVNQYIQPIAYNQSFEPIPGVTATLVDAGHILGSAAVILDIDEPGRKRTRLWFSGDIGRRNMPLLRDPVLPENADYLLMECTYGDKPHEDPELAFGEFRDCVVRTIKRRGKVIVPAFAVGRTQELVYQLHHMADDGDLPRNVPVFVDSPLAVHTTDVYLKHPECLDADTHAFIKDQTHPALYFDQLTYVQSVEESKSINDLKGPAIIISASGMAETGRILHHLKNNIENPNNTILIVSWQAPDTLGRRLADREKRVRIFGEEYQRRAEVDTIGGLSAHAGQTGLVTYACATQPTVKKIILVHGEPGPAQALTIKLGENGMHNIAYPKPHETLEL